MLFLISGCTAHQAIWDEGRTSSLRESSTNQKDSLISYSVVVGEPNRSHNAVFDSLKSLGKNTEQSLAVKRILQSMDLSGELLNQFKFIGSTESTENIFPINVQLNYGLSTDLQIAGIHALVQSADKGNSASRCIDEFDVIRTTGIPLQTEVLNGKDVRLVNRYEVLRSLFLEMADSIQFLSTSYYKNNDFLHIDNEARFAQLITFDGRFFTDTIMSTFQDGVLAYRDRPIHMKNCESIHLFLTNILELDTIEKNARSANQLRKLAASRNKFRREQQARNNRLMHQRIKNRVK